MRSWYQKYAIWNHTSIKCEPYKFPWPSENVDAVYNLSPLYLGEENFEVKFCLSQRNEQHRWSVFFGSAYILQIYHHVLLISL